MNIVRVMTCDSHAEAHILQGKLENEGVECFLTNEISTSILPQFNNMMGSGIQIMVREEDLIKAREVIQDIIAPDNSKLVCPNCGSANIALGRGKHSILKLFAMIISGFFGITMGYLKPKYYCRDCKTEIG